MYVVERIIKVILLMSLWKLMYQNATKHIAYMYLEQNIQLINMKKI